MEEVKVTLHYDENMWCAYTDDKRCNMALDAGSLDALIEKVKFIVYDIFEVDLKYKGPVKIVFQMDERTDFLEIKESA